MRISDEERRRRLVGRHYLAHPARGVLDAVGAMVAQHSSDPLTPHLGTRARLATFRTTDLDAELCEHRRLWRLHAMRRTLFVVPCETAPIMLAGAARAVARAERRRMIRRLEAEMPAHEVGAWLERTTGEVLDALGTEERSTAELSKLVPALQQRVTVGSGRWAQRPRVTSSLLLMLAMEALLVRTRPVGTWRSGQYRWANARTWFGPELLDAVARTDEREARVELARRYLESHGPATTADVVWWTGWNKGDTVRALAELDTVEVELDGGGSGLVLASDTDVDAPPREPTVALLPSLDATVMGWSERAWYLEDFQPELFDTVGNAGPTVWVDGRIVGGWGQRPDGSVIYELLTPVPRAACEAIGAVGDDLAAWLDGTVIAARFDAPLHRRLAATP